jgi:hypothetical protein
MTLRDKIKQEEISEEAKRRAKNYMALKDVMDAGTIEEAANVFSNGFQLWLKIDNVKSLREGFIEGAKWQSDRMYSEEEVRLMLSESFKASQEDYNITADEIIQQFKKK